MFEFVDHIRNYLKTPSPQMLAVRELEEAQRELLKSQSMYEYAGRMTSYHQELAEIMQKGHAKEFAKIKRQHEAKTDRALVKAADWKIRYQETRKQLLEARAEVHLLKAKLRNGDWE